MKEYVKPALEIEKVEFDDVILLSSTNKNNIIGEVIANIFKMIFFQ